MFLLKVYDFCLHENDGLHTEEAYAVCSQNKILLMERMQEHIDDLKRMRTLHIRELKNLTYGSSLHVYARFEGKDYVIAIIEPIEYIS